MQGAKLVNLPMSSRGSELTQLLKAVKYLGPVVAGLYLVDSQRQDHQRSMDQETAQPQRGMRFTADHHSVGFHPWLTIQAARWLSSTSARTFHALMPEGTLPSIKTFGALSVWLRDRSVVHGNGLDHCANERAIARTLRQNLPNDLDRVLQLLLGKGC